MVVRDGRFLREMDLLTISTENLKVFESNLRKIRLGEFLR